MARRARTEAAAADSQQPQEPEAPSVETPFGAVDAAGNFDTPMIESEPGTPDDRVQVEIGETRQLSQKGRSGPGRGWTQRYEQPVAYRRFTLKDEHGADKILFAFDLPPGQYKPDEEVVNVMRDHKYWKDGKPYGHAEDARTSEQSYSTGLQFGTNAKFPKAWVLPNNALGRKVADSIDQALDGVANKLMEAHAAQSVG
jgi:hypothetical protein